MSIANDTRRVLEHLIASNVRCSMSELNLKLCRAGSLAMKLFLSNVTTQSVRGAAVCILNRCFENGPLFVSLVEVEQIE